MYGSASVNVISHGQGLGQPIQSKDDHHKSLLASSQTNSVHNILRPVLHKNQTTLTAQLPGNRRKKFLRPRPSALTDAGYQTSGIVPGVDPTDWYHTSSHIHPLLSHIIHIHLL